MVILILYACLCDVDFLSLYSKKQILINYKIQTNFNDSTINYANHSNIKNASHYYSNKNYT